MLLWSILTGLAMQDNRIEALSFSAILVIKWPSLLDMTQLLVLMHVLPWMLTYNIPPCYW